MRRRAKKSNWPLMAASAALIAACGSGLVYMGVEGASKSTPDKWGCYAQGPKPPAVAVMIDSSIPRWNEEQLLSLWRDLPQRYFNLAFNQPLHIYTSEGDVVSSIPAPRVSVCGQARTAEDLEEINAESGSPQWLERGRERFYEKVLKPELDEILAIQPSDHERLQTQQSPVMEMIQGITRAQTLAPGSTLVVVSDLIQNSDSVQFCRTFNDMPPFDSFKQRPVYQKIKPASLDDVNVEVLMLQRFGYGDPNGPYQYCKSEDELMTFWREYFEDNGASVSITRIRHGYAGVQP